MEEIQPKVIKIISEKLGKDVSEIKISSHFIQIRCSNKLCKNYRICSKILKWKPT